MVFIWGLLSGRKKASAVKHRKKEKKKFILSSSSPSSVGSKTGYTFNENGDEEFIDGYQATRASLSTSALTVPPSLKFAKSGVSCDLDTSRSAPPMSHRVKFHAPGPEGSTIAQASPLLLDKEFTLEVSESSASTHRSLYVPDVNSLRRKSGVSGCGEFLELNEHVDIPSEVINLSEYRLIAFCDGFENVWLSRMDYGKGAYAVLKICEMVNTNVPDEHSKRSLHEVAVHSHVCSEKFSEKYGHANIVLMYDFFVLPNNMMVIAMEHCIYGSLQLFLNVYKRRFLHAERMKIAYDFTRGLGYLHFMEVAHRDFKPENIGLTWCNRQKRVVAKIFDFGHAMISTMSTRELGILGSPGYMAPEILELHSTGSNISSSSSSSSLQPQLKILGVDAILADVWAWAVTFYRLVEDDFPFVFDDFRIDLSSYRKPVVMREVPDFCRTMNNCFVIDPLKRLSIFDVLNGSFLAGYKSAAITHSDVDSLMQTRLNE